jgi:translocation protein SEC63
VKLTENVTAESVATKFVELTKAYKSYVFISRTSSYFIAIVYILFSLTDETIRSNYEKYGHPDGRQPVTMGIALPIWVIEGKNNIWVLGLYGLIFGFALPALVGRWWFGNQRKTKDGVDAKTAAVFFTTLKEDWGPMEVAGVLSKGFAHELPKTTGYEKALGALEGVVRSELGDKWELLTESADIKNAEDERKAIILLYAHLLRLPIEDLTLRKGE